MNSSRILSEQEQFRARIDAIAKCDKPTDEVIFKCQLEAQDAKSIAARDKEWVEKEKNLVSFISLIIKREGCIDALECEHNEGCVENVLHGKCNKAQELKKEVSNGK